MKFKRHLNIKFQPKCRMTGKKIFPPEFILINNTVVCFPDSQ